MPAAAVARCLDLLERAFGRPRRRRRLPPLDELILTILSQNTTDANRDRADADLRRAFPDWGAVLRADRAAVERAVRVAGLARTKARTIQEALARLARERGTLDLGFLETMTPEAARAVLRSFRGVGDKTACCVLLFSCGLPAFPVDTHIHRVARRLGWVPVGATRGTSHAILARLVPEPRYYAAHVNLITLGRRFCRPRAPACPACPLGRLCPSARAWRAAGGRPIFPSGRAVSGTRGGRQHARRVQGRARLGGRRGARPRPHRRPQGPGGE